MSRFKTAASATGRGLLAGLTVVAAVSESAAKSAAAQRDLEHAVAAHATALADFVEYPSERTAARLRTAADQVASLTEAFIVAKGR